eukprot:m.14733 g.14733  ORF g.14733 m.14733 type:complete len:381 (-) comp3188_c0_seq2:176-1318(-)
MAAPATVLTLLLQCPLATLGSDPSHHATISPRRVSHPTLGSARIMQQHADDANDADMVQVAPPHTVTTAHPTAAPTPVPWDGGPSCLYTTSYTSWDTFHDVGNTTPIWGLPNNGENWTFYEPCSNPHGCLVKDTDLIMVIGCDGSAAMRTYCGYYINGATPGVLGSPVGWSKVSPGGKMAFGPSFTGASSNTFQLDDGGVSQPGQDGGPSATVPAVKGRPDLNWSHYTPVGYRYHPIKGPYPQQNLFLTLEYLKWLCLENHTWTTTPAPTPHHNTTTAPHHRNTTTAPHHHNTTTPPHHRNTTTPHPNVTTTPHHVHTTTPMSIKHPQDNARRDAEIAGSVSAVCVVLLIAGFFLRRFYRRRQQRAETAYNALPTENVYE